MTAAYPLFCAILVFHFFAVVNPSDPLDNDLVAHANPRLDDEDVFQFILDHDLAQMRHILLVDDVNVPLAEDFEGRPLRDDDGVIQHSTEQHGTSLTVTQQAARVRKVRAESDGPGLVVEIGRDRTKLADLPELLAVRQDELDSWVLLTPSRVGHVLEITGFGYVEIDPHHAVIGQGREDVPLPDQAADLRALAVDDAVERRSNLGKVQFGLRQIRVGLGLRQLGLEQFHLVLRGTLFLGQLPGVIQLQFAWSLSAAAASHFAL